MKDGKIPILTSSDLEMVRRELKKRKQDIKMARYIAKDCEVVKSGFFYSSQPLQTSHQPVAPDTSSSSEGVSFTEVNEFPPAG